MTLEKALNTAEEAKKPRPQATFKQDAPIKVTFSKQAYIRRDPAGEESDQEFRNVYIDLLDGRGKTNCGEAYMTEGDFDVEILVDRSCQPYAFQILGAAERHFRTKNVSVQYYD